MRVFVAATATRSRGEMVCRRHSPTARSKAVKSHRASELQMHLTVSLFPCRSYNLNQPDGLNLIFCAVVEGCQPVGLTYYSRTRFSIPRLGSSSPTLASTNLLYSSGPPNFLSHPEIEPKLKREDFSFPIHVL